MLKIDHQQILKRYYQLPRSLQEAMFSERSADTIGKTCVLREAEQYTSKIAALTGRVLLGYLRPETFAFEIQKETGMDALKATQVAHDIDTEIFSEVRLELKKLYPPTIQTPTVQVQGFTPRESGIRNQESGTGFQDSGFKIQEQKPAPRYVVQIPERFKKTTDNSKLITHNEGAAQPAPKAQVVIPDSQFMNHDSGAPIQEKQGPAPSHTEISTENLSGQAASSQNIPPHPNEAISYKLKASEGPPMDPIVPLPTFIQSKFKADELGMAGQESGIRNQESRGEQKTAAAQDAQDALKSAFGKFTTSSTATGVAQEPASPYREPVEESKKPGEQKPTAKVQGKVIDLSRF